ncbi:DUF7344 domain-containing protein [Halomarina litorea]|uniref:DUF7344 domain-containing protein n=1 Tax=Halomarina litorea TaxID=2961595 RepID=UPI0020C4C1B8|nr:ArsR family transcriptional regulator [Halomarina sp. BCD28]
MKNPIMSLTTDSASLDTMLDMLSNSHRRRILLAVSDHNPRHEDEFTLDELDDDNGRRLKISLRHAHLPKLADKGYIEWDPDTQTIRRGPNFDDIAPLLRLMEEHHDELPDDWP